MRAAIIFLLLIPAFIALGHDFYLFYNEHMNPGIFSIDLLMEKFKFSALGFIWTTYEVESYRSVVAGTAPETWAIIDNILTWKAFYVGLGFAGIFIILFLFLKLFGIGPFVNQGRINRKQKDTPESFRAGAKSKKMQYTRK